MIRSLKPTLFDLPKCISFSAYFVFLICLRGVETEMKTIEVYPGELVQLQCPLNKTTQQILTWNGPPDAELYAVGEEEVYKYQDLIKVEGCTFHIFNISKIPNITEKTYGTFNCSIGFEAFRFNVTIRKQPSLDIKEESRENVTLIRCSLKNYKLNYKFIQWEHKTEFKAHIRYLNGTKSSGKEYSELHIPTNDSNRTLKERGFYICKVKDDVQRVFMSNEYFLKLQGKPYFVASNDLLQNGTLVRENQLHVKFVSYPNITSHSLSTDDKDITKSTNFTIKEDNFTDIIYGQTVMVRGYLLQYSFVVTSKQLLNEYSVTVRNRFGETKIFVRIYFSKFESDGFKTDDTGLTSLQVFLVITGVAVVLIILTAICVKLYKVRALKRRRQRNTRSRPNGPSTFEMHKIYLSSWDING